MKKCSTCKESKALDQFYNNRSKSDGKALQCVSCYKAGNYGKTLECNLCGTEFTIKHRNIKKRKHKKCTPCTQKVSSDKRRTTSPYIVDHGYKRGKGNQKFEHRAVMEKHLGRPLHRSEIVHHIDNNKTNNDLSNLWLTNLQDHSKAHDSLEKVAVELFRQGLIEFNVLTGEYKLR